MNRTGLAACRKRGARPHAWPSRIATCILISALWLAIIWLAGCAAVPPDPTIDWVGGVATYRAIDDTTFELELAQPQRILGMDGTWMVAAPLSARQGESITTVWITSEYEIARRDFRCQQVEEGACVSGSVQFDDVGEPAPLAVGLRARDHIDVDGKRLPVERDGALVRAGPFVALEAGPDPVTLSARFDGSPFPEWVRYIDDAGTKTQEFIRIQLGPGSPLDGTDAIAPAEPAATGWPPYELFPGENEDVLERGFGPIEPYHALMDQSEEARELADRGCLVQLWISPNRSSSEIYDVPPLWSRPTDFAFVHLGEPGSDSVRWILSRSEDSLGRSTWKIDVREDRRPVACSSDAPAPSFAIDAGTVMQRFHDLDLTYQSTPGFRIEYREIDVANGSRDHLRFAVTAAPTWVDLNASLHGYVPHTVRIAVETGHFRLIQHDPVDYPKFVRPEG